MLTANKAYEAEGVILCHSLEELPRVLADYEDDDIFVIGGGSIYEQLLPQCKKLILPKSMINFLRILISPIWMKNRNGH